MRATRYRRAQAAVVLLLSALVTASLVFAPLFARAVAHASLTSRLAQGGTDLRLTSWSASDPSLVRGPRALLGLVPADLRAHHGTPFLAQFVMVTDRGSTPTPLAWTSRGCDGVMLTSGTCPTAPGEVLLPSGGLPGTPNAVGTELTLTESDDAVREADSPPGTTATVVGTYEPMPGTPQDLGIGTGAAVPAPILGVSVTRWSEPHNVVVLPLRPDTVTPENIAGLGDALASFVRRPWAATASTPAEQQATLPVYAASGIPAVADAVATDRRQAGVTVPVLTVQLAVLLAVVLWLVLVAATEQRRAEVAVAKLRGRGAAGSRSLLLRETLPPVLLGVPLGAVLAVGLWYAARRLVLPAAVPFEVPAAAWGAAVVAAVVMVVLAVLSVRRAAEEPVAGLLRSVPARGRGVALGLLEAMVVAAALAAFLALATGSVTGPVALAAPTLLAVAVGIVGARAVPLLLSWVGARLLRTGRPTGGAALLQAARRPATRWLLPVVTVGLCLAVFAADAVAVSSRNRHDRAGAEVGAAAVLTVAPADARTVSAAVSALDPRGQTLTPVATVTPPSLTGAATLAVRPGPFARIAAWPGVDPAGLGWSRLRPATPRPMLLTGTRLHAVVGSTGLIHVETTGSPQPVSPVAVSLFLVGADGTDRRVVLTHVGKDPSTRQVDVALPCEDTCTVRGLGVSSAVGQSAVDTVTIRQVSTDLGAVDLRSTSQWRSHQGDAGAVTAQAVSGGLRLLVDIAGGAELVLESAGLPASVPALATTALRASTDLGATAQTVDGTPIGTSVVGSVPFAPGSRASTLVVDYDTLALQRWRGTGNATLRIYSGRADSAYLSSVTQRLSGLGVRVTGTQTQAAAESRYAASAAAWSMQLALVVGLLAVLVVALALVVLVQTSASERSRDYAGLRMAGLSRRGVGRVAVGELLPVVVIGAVLGTGAGLLAASAAMPLVPLFPTASSVIAPNLSMAWWAAGAAALAALAVLAATAWFAARRVADRSRLARLREAA